MIKRFLIGAFAITGVVVAFAQMPMTSSRKKHPLHIQLTGLNNTNSDGVSRLKINLIGLSHSSSRVDSAKIFMADGAVYMASDIDGIDFGRYFQWEDNGVIPIEIDFPKVEKYISGDTIVFYTVHGQYKQSLNK